MKSIQIHSCFASVGGSYCLVMISDDGTLLPIMLDNDTGKLVETYISGDFDDKVIDYGCSSSILYQIDMTPVFVEVEYNEDEHAYQACLCTYQKNEIQRKFYRISLPFSLAITYGICERLSFVTDEMLLIERGKYSMEDIDSYINNGE